MSVLIKDMEMPKNCNECPCFCPGYTSFSGYEYPSKCRVLNSIVVEQGTHPHCPLIEVETVAQTEAIVPINMIGGYLREVKT